MTEREKIIEIIAPYVAAYGEDEAIANALIAAGLKFDRNISYTATFNLAQLERINDLERRLAATDHRAARAERALVNTCAILYAQGVESPYSDEEWQLQQAEKELQEERKDD